MKVLMVCLGNICRSPLAEGILHQKISESNLDWVVDSAGTSGFHNGELPDSRSMDIAVQYNIDISHQRSRIVTQDDLANFDLIFAMDSSNYNSLIKMATGPQKSKIKLIMNMVNDRNENVPDPYYNDGFESVFIMLEKACQKIIETYV